MQETLAILEREDDKKSFLEPNSPLHFPSALTEEKTDAIRRRRYRTNKAGAVNNFPVAPQAGEIKSKNLVC